MTIRFSRSDEILVFVNVRLWWKNGHSYLPQKMNPCHQKSSSSWLFFWRNVAFRSIFYQVVVLCALLGAGFAVFQNVASNLSKRGIASGFSFLKNEAGFGISEVVPIPLLEGGFLYFIAALFTGLFGVFILSRYAGSKGIKIGEDNRLSIIAFLLIFVLPGAVLYSTGHTIRTVTYTEVSSYAIAILTALLNTIKLAFLGCILISILGFLIGIARLSSNWLVSRLAAVYIETMRNVPVLLHILFWYFTIIGILPGVRQSIKVFNIIILNNRGIFLPEPVPNSGFRLFLLLMIAGIIAIGILARYANVKRDQTGQRIPVFYSSIAILVGCISLSWLVDGAPVSFVFPVLKGFNYEGGVALSPEFAAMLFALVIYTAAYVAEIVRSGIQAITRGQIEAGLALGLKEGMLLRLVILPQALRVIIPPLTGQYISLTKDTSLGMVIAYPELVSVGGTTISQTAQSVEIIAITMAVFLTLNLLISLGLNWYNAKIKLVEG